jgi:hypothetical protein
MRVLSELKLSGVARNRCNLVVAERAESRLV